MPKSVFAVIIGKANAGKSSLLNFLVGEKVSIVSEKPQTTRARINGIVTRGETQFVFIDTPGIHKPRNCLSNHMVKTARASVSDVDVVLMIADCTKRVSENINAKGFLNIFKQSGSDVILLLNKTDLIKNKLEILKLIKEYSELYSFREIIPISVKKGENIDGILPVIERYAQEGAHFFPDDITTDQAEKFWLAELVREKIFRETREEVPYGTAVEIENLDKTKTNKGVDIVDLSAVIICEKNNHKGILIGKQGINIKKIGTEVRAEMEKYFDCKVNIKFWVKVKEDWRNKEYVIAEMGLQSE